jgi:hypothetical protein
LNMLNDVILKYYANLRNKLARKTAINFFVKVTTLKFL